MKMIGINEKLHTIVISTERVDELETIIEVLEAAEEENTINFSFQTLRYEPAEKNNA